MDCRIWSFFIDSRNNNRDRKSTRLNSSHRCISYAVFCLKKNADGSSKRPPVQEQLRGKFERGLLCVCQSLRPFFFNDTATPEIYPLSLHGALPISQHAVRTSTVGLPTQFMISLLWVMVG